MYKSISCLSSNYNIVALIFCIFMLYVYRLMYEKKKEMYSLKRSSNGQDIICFNNTKKRNK